MMAHYNCLTARVIRVWADVDSVWEQKKLEARKMPENGARPSGSPQRPVHVMLARCLIGKKSHYSRFQGWRNPTIHDFVGCVFKYAESREQSVKRMLCRKDLTRIALDPKHPRKIASEAELWAL